MSFGFSAGDFIKIAESAHKIVKSCQSGSREYRALSAEARALHTIIVKLRKDAEDGDSLLNRKGAKRRNELLALVGGADDVLHEILDVLKKNIRLAGNDDDTQLSQILRPERVKKLFQAWEVGSSKEEYELLTGRLTFHVSCINAFLHSLEGAAISRIERKLDAIYKSLVKEEDVPLDDVASIQPASIYSTAESISSRLETDEDEVWRELKRSLAEEDLTPSTVSMYREEVIAYLKEKLQQDFEERRGQEKPSNPNEPSQTWFQTLQMEKLQWKDITNGLEMDMPVTDYASMQMPNAWHYEQYNGTLSCFLTFSLGSSLSHATSPFECRIQFHSISSASDHTPRILSFNYANPTNENRRGWQLFQGQDGPLSSYVETITCKRGFNTWTPTSSNCQFVVQVQVSNQAQALQLMAVMACISNDKRIGERGFSLKLPLSPGSKKKVYDLTGYNSGY